MRQMQERRAQAGAKEEQKGNREKRKPKTEKLKEISSTPSSYAGQFGNKKK
jgi:hypothetical protein